jgi:hypothetical protein
MRTNGPGTRAIPKSGIAVPRAHVSLGVLATAGWAPGTLGTLSLAAILTGTPVVLHLAGQGVGIAACVLLALLVANIAAPAVPIALLFSCLFQNLFVALVSPAVATIDQLDTMRAYNFLLTAAVWVVIAASYWTARARFDRDLRVFIDVTTAALVVIGLYFVVGLAANPTGAIVYLRNIVMPILMFQVFALVAYRHRLSVTTPLVVMATAALVYGYLELLAHDDLFWLVNGDIYLTWRTKQDHEPNMWLKELNETGRVIRSFLDTMIIDFLNTPMLADLGWRFYRIVGPNFHPISYAYALGFFSTVLFAVGHWWYPLLALPLLLVIGSKGALVFMALVTAATAAVLRPRGPAALWIYSAVLLLYVAGGIVTGIQAQDYHVIGFIGGLKGFIGNPIGHGIGVGGNLSLDMNTIDWNKSQYFGHTDIAVESAIGVLLYQMGIFGAVLLGVFVWIAMKLWKWHLRSGSRLYATGCFALLIVTANGIFQEEAIFAPLALGTVLALAGLLLGRAYRTTPDQNVGSRQAR